MTNGAEAVSRTSLCNLPVVAALKQPHAMRMCPYDGNDTIKHQRSLLCFNGTFNKTDISSSQQQCLDREDEGVGAGWGFPLLIGWLLLISERELDEENWRVLLGAAWGRWRAVSVCVCVCTKLIHLGWRVFLLPCPPKNNNNVAKRTQTMTIQAPLPLVYLQGKLIHSVNSLSNKAN